MYKIIPNTNNEIIIINNSDFCSCSGIGAHTLSLVGVGAFDSYCVSELHSVNSVHSLLLVFVRAFDSYSFWLHTVNSVHTLSLFVVGSVDSYCLSVHTVNALHSLLLLYFGAFVWYSFDPHFVNFFTAGLSAVLLKYCVLKSIDIKVGLNGRYKVWLFNFMLLDIVVIRVSNLQLKKAPRPILVIVPRTNNLLPLNPVQSWKAKDPIVVTLVGIIKLPVNPLQPSKAPVSIVFKLLAFEKFIPLNFLQFLKA